MPETIQLQIATPNGVFEGDFPKTTKVADVIAAAAKAMNLNEGDAFELVHEGQVLPPTRPLVSFGFSGTVKVELVATGSGVGR